MRTSSGRAKPLPPEERRAAIIEATLPLLRAHGKDVSTRQIAEAAGVAEGTIFRVFDDKASLIDAAIRSAFDPARPLAALDQVDPTQPLQARLVQVARVLKDRLADVFVVLDAIGHTGPPDTKWNPPRRPTGNDVLVERIVDVIGDDAMSLRVSPVETARILSWMVFTNSHPVLGQGAHLEPEVIVSVILDGVRCRPAPAPRTVARKGK